MNLCFKVCAPIDTTQLGLDVKKDADSWQALYDGIRATGEQCGVEGLHFARRCLRLCCNCWATGMRSVEGRGGAG